MFIKTRWSEKASTVRGDLRRDPLLKKMDRAMWIGVLGTHMYPVQRPWGGNILYSAYSENNLEINVAGAECAGRKGRGQGEAGGENGVRCWGSSQGTERPLAFMLQEAETEECEAETLCDPAFH